MKISEIRNHRSYKVIMVLIALLICAVTFTISYKIHQKNNHQRGIEDIVAQKYNKEIKKLTSEDYKKIETIELSKLELSNLNSLKKLTNLKELSLSNNL